MEYRLLQYIRTEYPITIITPEEKILLVLETSNMELEVGRIYRSKTEVESIRWVKLERTEAELAGLMLEAIREARFHIRTLIDNHVWVDPNKPYDVNNKDQTIIKYGMISINIEKLVKDRIEEATRTKTLMSEKEMENLLSQYYRLLAFSKS